MKSKEKTELVYVPVKCEDELPLGGKFVITISDDWTVSDLMYCNRETEQWFWIGEPNAGTAPDIWLKEIEVNQVSGWNQGLMDDAYMYLSEKDCFTDMKIQLQIEIQEALRIASGKYATQPPPITEGEINEMAKQYGYKIAFGEKQSWAIKDYIAGAKAIIEKLKR